MLEIHCAHDIILFAPLADFFVSTLLVSLTCFLCRVTTRRWKMLNYLTLPGTKVEMEEKELQASKNTANFAAAKDSTKDSFQIATSVCSTKPLPRMVGAVTGMTPEWAFIGSSWAPLLNSGDWTICLLR